MKRQSLLCPRAVGEERNKQLYAGMGLALDGTIVEVTVASAMASSAGIHQNYGPRSRLKAIRLDPLEDIGLPSKGDNR